MKRRDFIKGTAVLVAASTTTGNVLRAAEKVETKVSNGTEEEVQKKLPLIASSPMLQNYAHDSMGVVFAVNDLANGYVIYGRKKDLSDGVKVKCGGYRTTEISDKVIQVRLTGLKSATKYYYRIGADRISYKGGYSMKIIGNEEDSKIYSFTTAGSKAKGHFCVINDTHVKWKPFALALKKISEVEPSCVVWNGDACNTEEKIDDQIRIFLKPEVEIKDYASCTPYLFVPGNHDYRGMANRHLENVWMYRQNEERLSRDWDLGRNFAVRMGDIAMIGLDTGEDKLDTNPLFAGLFNNEPYRKAQKEWLKNVLEREEIASAPFLVAFCHIPLFDPDPTANPGDVKPNDYDPQYTHDYAIWQRTCAKLWGPLLEKAGCQVVITAHQHKYRFDAPDGERGWAQIVGGGPHLESSDKSVYPTVIEGKVRGHELRIDVHNLQSGKVQDSFTFDSRLV